MKKAMLILFGLAVPFIALTQEKRKEVGMVFSNFNNFGFTYRTGTEKAVWRFNTMIASGSSMSHITENNSQDFNSMGVGAGFGREYRKTLSENLELRYGADVSFQYHHNKSEKEGLFTNVDNQYFEENSYIPGMNLVFGFNYLIQEKIIIGAELQPYFNYRFGTSYRQTVYDTHVDQINSEFSGFNYGFNSNSFLMSLAFRF